MTDTRIRADWALPETAAYTEATATFNIGQQLRPSAALVARDVATVQEAVRETVRATPAVGGRIIPITTGHAAIMTHQSSATRLIRTEIEAPIEVDAERRLVTFPAGALWRDVVTAAAAHGFAVPHGSSGTVGAVGYLLGGGVSFYGRALGVAANHLESLRIVTADGEERHVDADHDPDLFWAVRGGGGGFGIVTSVTLRLSPITTVVTGMAVWPAEHGAELLEVWRRWAATAPREATTTLRLLDLPPMPELPPAMTDGQVMVIDGVVLPPAGDVLEAERIATDLLAPLRAVAEPTLSTWHTGPVTDVLETHGDPQEPVPSLGDSFTIGDFTAEAAAAWFHTMGPASPAPHVVSAELRQLGGAFRDPVLAGGAFDRIDADVLALAIDFAADPAGTAEADARTLRPRTELERWITPWTAPTLVDNPRSPRRSFAAEVEVRVEEIRRRVDPDGVFTLDARPSIDVG